LENQEVLEVARKNPVFFLLGDGGSNLPIYRLVLRMKTPETERNLKNDHGFLLEIDKIWRIIV
jgi:hypothetical protein